MSYFELNKDKVIKYFIKSNKQPSEEDLFNIFYDYFLHPDLETEFTHKVARNIIKITYKYYLALSEKKKFHFLRAIGKLLDVSLSMKEWEFQLSRNDASWFWKGFPTYFISLTHITKTLEELRYEMSIVDKKCLHSKIICVEGETEFNFLRILYLTTKFSSFDFSIYNYKGKGEIQNLNHFIKEKNRQGIMVYISYDSDKKSKSFINKIKSKCRVEKFFGFEKDFESSFPPRVLELALKDYIKRYNKSNHISVDIKVIKDLLKQPQPFIKAFEQKYIVKINKVKLSSILAKVMADIIFHYWNKIFNEKNKEKFFTYEVFKFLKFLIT